MLTTLTCDSRVADCLPRRFVQVSSLETIHPKPLAEGQIVDVSRRGYSIWNTAQRGWWIPFGSNQHFQEYRRVADRAADSQNGIRQVGVLFCQQFKPLTDLLKLMGFAQ
jgi:hypothetical protein